MACNSTTCRSGCYGDDPTDGEQKELQRQPVSKNTSRESNGGISETHSVDNSYEQTCIKCKVNTTIAATGGGINGGDAGRFCADCFRSNLFGKFRFAVTSNAMISPSDKVLVAFSGGASSRVALQFVHEMQDKAQKNFDASRDKALPVFGVGVAFIDEKAIFPVPSHEFDNAIEDMKMIVSDLGPPKKQFHVAPTESIYSLDPADARERLNELVNSVSDITGKEDLIKHLRMFLLQKIALNHGYTKLVLGTCTSRIACHVLEATVKGQGYSLAADIQYVDARREIPVLLPLRDCLASELNMLCSLDSLRRVEAFKRSRSGINGLISSFVKLLQEENPSRESTIVRTAGKLTPFHFNKMPEPDDLNGHLASRRRQKKYNLKVNESLPPESFCRICNSPLKNDFVSSARLENGSTGLEFIREACCSSCHFQILPKEPSSVEHFSRLLPLTVVSSAKDGSSAVQRLLRQRIEDCLLSDSEDVN